MVIQAAMPRMGGRGGTMTERVWTNPSQMPRMTQGLTTKRWARF
jgi:hypothetical protein